MDTASERQGLVREEEIQLMHHHNWKRRANKFTQDAGRIACSYESMIEGTIRLWPGMRRKYVMLNAMANRCRVMSDLALECAMAVRHEIEDRDWGDDV
jgi:hypothetical protein